MNNILKNAAICCTGAAMGLATILFERCVGNKSAELGPAETIEAFYTALTSGDFESAEDYCNSSETKEYVYSLRAEWEKSGKNISEILPAIMAETDIRITDVVKNGQNRTVFYTLISGDGTQKEKIATVRKIEGVWIITEITDRQ